MFGSARADKGVVEIIFHDGRKLVKKRSDLLTGSVVEQAISSAIDRTVSAAIEEKPGDYGLTGSCLVEALRQHLDSLADNLSPHNAADYLDLPENTQIVEVRRLKGFSGQLPPMLSDLDY